jgi:hypothetical protein
MIDLEKLSSRAIVALIATGLILASLFLGVHEGIMTQTDVKVFHDSTGYGHLSSRYFQLTLCWSICLIGFRLTQRWLSGIISIGSLLLALYPFTWIYPQKAVYLVHTDSFSAILRGTIAIDWIMLVLMFLLLGYKLISPFSYFLNLFSRNNIK